MIKDTEDIFRLYRPEWVIVATFANDGDDANESVLTARRFITISLTGRVHEQNIALEVNTDDHGQFWTHVKVFKDTLKGEFKYASNADRHATVQGYEEYTVVARNSKGDHDIRAYGVRKL